MYQSSSIVSPLCAWFVAILLGVPGANVCADVVAASGRPAMINVEILSLRGGQLQYQLHTGRRITRPIEQIEYLQIRNWPLFNLAEKQQRDQRYRQAINSYEKTLERLTNKDPAAGHGSPAASGSRGGDATGRGSTASRSLDCALLLKIRLLAAYDAEGRFDRAVATYLDILEVDDGHAYAEVICPKHLPAAGSTFLATAAAQVEAALDQHGPDPIGVALARWRSTWPDAQQRHDQADQAEPLATTRPTTSKQIQQAQQALSDIQSLFDAKRFDEVIQRIDHWQERNALNGMLRPDLYYWRARTLLARSAGRDSEPARPDQRRAGLALMRVVIHFPGHALVPECLHRAAEICLQHDRPQQATALWTELIEAHASAKPWSDWARRELKRLGGSGSAPVP